MFGYNHSRLIADQKQLGYRRDAEEVDEGCCFGWAIACIQAIELGKLTALRERGKLLSATDNFSQTISAVKQKKGQNLSEQDRQYWNSAAFIDAVNFLQNISKYRELLDENLTQSESHKALKWVSPFVLGQEDKEEKDGPIAALTRVSSYYSNYSREELIAVFRAIILSAEKHSVNFSMLFGNISHAMAFSYRADDHIWIVVDANKMNLLAEGQEIIYKNNPEELAQHLTELIFYLINVSYRNDKLKEVLQNIPKKDWQSWMDKNSDSFLREEVKKLKYTLLDTEIYGAPENATKIKVMMDEAMQDSKCNKALELTDEKLIRKAADGSSIIFMAAKKGSGNKQTLSLIERIAKLDKKLLTTPVKNSSEGVFSSIINSVFGGVAYFPFVPAIQRGDIRALDIFAQYIPNFYQPQGHGMLIFITAVMGNHKELAHKAYSSYEERLISKGPIRLEHLAARCNSYECIGLFQVFDQKDDEGLTPLHYAARDGYMKTVLAIKKRMRLWSGDDDDFFKLMDLCDPRGRTPLHDAAEHGHADMVVFLVKNNAAIYCQDEAGNLPMDLALRAGHGHLVENFMRLDPEFLSRSFRIQLSSIEILIKEFNSHDSLKRESKDAKWQDYRLMAVGQMLAEEKIITVENKQFPQIVYQKLSALAKTFMRLDTICQDLLKAVEKYKDKNEANSKELRTKIIEIVSNAYRDYGSTKQPLSICLEAVITAVAGLLPKKQPVNKLSSFFNKIFPATLTGDLEKIIDLHRSVIAKLVISEERSNTSQITPRPQ